ncbi:hypothetical protein CEP54_001932 [Fusarium duplospermum]|uniref:Uncharacterized protein n=1 Tax=Fusarium duplospermum TaxID=1325734 RepID=A0A428QY86_9HYPO|nr:hypothetical protein CEP54_001932 [Fusarium duplospermum]
MVGDPPTMRPLSGVHRTPRQPRWVGWWEHATFDPGDYISATTLRLYLTTLSLHSHASNHCLQRRLTRESKSRQCETLYNSLLITLLHV